MRGEGRGREEVVPLDVELDVDFEVAHRDAFVNQEMRRLEMFRFGLVTSPSA